MAGAFQATAFYNPAFYVAVDVTAAAVWIHDINRTSDVRLDSLDIDDDLNEAPNTCTLTITGPRPIEGQEIIVQRPGPIREFAGTILRVEQIYESIRANVAFHVTAQDYTWLLNRRLVTKRWTGQTATAIAQDLITSYTSGFTSTNVVAGLATIPLFECVTETVARALTRLAEQAGTQWYIDYNKDLHFFVTETTDPPADISDVTLGSGSTARALVHAATIAQVRTRVLGTGKGVTVAADCAVGQSTIPLSTGRTLTPFSATGGQAISGANIVSYTGLSSGDYQGSNVLGPLVNPAAPSAVVSTTRSGGAIGTYRYKKIDVIDDPATEQRGGSEPSPASGPVTATTIGAPSFPVRLAALGHSTSLESANLSRSGSEVTILSGPSNPSPTIGQRVKFTNSASGAYNGTYEVAKVDSSGRSIFTGISTAAPSSENVTMQRASGGALIGNYRYMVTLASAEGDTPATDLGTLVAPALAPVPGALPTLTPTDEPSPGPGNGLSGSYWYWMSWTAAEGESGLTFLGSVNVTGGNNAVTLSGLYTGETDPRLLNRRLYRSKGNAAIPFLLKTLDLTITTTLTDFLGDAALGALPQPHPLGSGVSLLLQVTPTDPRIRAWRLWRTKANVDGVYYLAAELKPDPSGILSYYDALDDNELGEKLESTTVNTFGGAAIDVTVPLGTAPGTVSRKIFRTKAGGTTYFACGSIGDNTTTTPPFVDRKADEDLGEEMPLDSTLKTLPGSTTLRVVNGADYSPTGGWTKIGSQVIRYTGVSGTAPATLIGIPSSGLGAITVPISADSEVAVVPFLVGVTGILYPIAQGDRIRIYVMREDVAAQSRIAYPPEQSAPSYNDYAPLRISATVNVQMAQQFRSGISDYLRSATLVLQKQGTVTGSIFAAIETDVGGIPSGVRVGTASSLIDVGGWVAGVDVVQEFVFPVSPFLTAGVQYWIVLAGTYAFSGSNNIMLRTSTTPPLYADGKVADYNGTVWSAATAYDWSFTTNAFGEPGDGIHEATINDDALDTVAALTAACNAELANFARTHRSIRFTSRDPKLRTGKTITLNLASPTSLNGAFLIQKVITTGFNIGERYPLRAVTAEPVSFTFLDFLRRGKL